MHPKLPSTAVALAFVTVGTLAGTGTAQAHAASPQHAASPPSGVAGAPGGSVRQQADRIMSLSYGEFAETPRIAPFNWTTDGCSVPSSITPYREVFELACNLHDFGYRNYGGKHELKLSPTRETKNWIDGRFREEMVRTCRDTYKTPLRQTSCVSAAETYYQAVNKSPQAERAFGLASV
ncbi:phospholipase A2 [Streptomyces iconiensis]|uniref:Phospholipase A2 n=1 Tax=Streptomyces iconiensis TaxID=1384038 RepID=A0ABT6ZTS8_9ACTN|nr:phospholipase A2 [Streptomyces iconiensis]MDJ1132469.1 phospholipase A2 [Streptomyces iconiensis]